MIFLFKQRPIFAISLSFLAFILLGACQSQTVSGKTTSDQQSTQTSPDGQSTLFSVAPIIFDTDAILTISLPPERPKNIAIRTPSDVWYIIQNAEEDISFLDDKVYNSSPNIDISVASLKGVVWENGEKKIQAVFTQPGAYTIYIADNLETEPENTFHFMKKVTLK